MTCGSNSANLRKNSQHSPRAKRLRRFFSPTWATLCLLVALLAPQAGGASLHPITPAWTDLQKQRLQARLGQIFASSLADARRYSLVVQTARGQTLFSKQAMHAVAAASTQKLIVTTAAWHILGPRFRFQTLLAATGTRGSRGVLHGSLWLIGSGDPSFGHTQLQGMARSLRAAGYTRIDGAFNVDARAVREPAINPLWNQHDDDEGFQAPTSGISLAGNTIEVVVAGEKPVQAKAPCTLAPDVPVLVQSQVRAVNPDDATGIHVHLLPITHATNNGAYRLTGSLARGDSEKLWLPILHAPRFAAAVALCELRMFGIPVRDGAHAADAPLHARVLSRWKSRRLPALLHHMLVESENHYAEELLAAIARVWTSHGDLAQGLAVEREMLARWQIPTPGVHLVDASGLAHANRVSADTLAALLRLDRRRLPALLPRGGRDGTLKHVTFGAADGRIRAKTGHLDGVSALAGYVRSRRHGTLIFAFAVDGSPGDPDAAFVRAVDALSEF